MERSKELVLLVRLVRGYRMASPVEGPTWPWQSARPTLGAMHSLSLWERVRAYYHTITAPLSKPYRGAETELWCGPHKRKKFEGKKIINKPHI